MEEQYDLGIYDSGIGGLTIAYALLHKHSSMRILYYADTAYLPLGDKSPDVIKARTIRAVEYFKEKNCKAILFACNTVSTISYDYLTNAVDDVPIFNVVDTLMSRLAEHSYKNLLLFSTSATQESGVFERKLKELSNIENFQVLAAPKLVPYIEARNTYKGDKIKDYLLSLKEKSEFKPDAIVFGCTHYPIVRHVFKEVYNGGTKFHDAIIPTINAIEEKISIPQSGSPTKMVIRCSEGSPESLVEHYLKIDAYESAYT